jgi:hypothetical protein
MLSSGLSFVLNATLDHAVHLPSFRMPPLPVGFLPHLRRWCQQHTMQSRLPRRQFLRAIDIP